MISHLTVNVSEDSTVETNHKTNVAESDITRILGTWYVSADGHNPTAQQAYDVIARINEVWYDMIPVPVIWTDRDPYDDYQDMKESVQEDNELRVFAGGSEPEFMSHTDNVKGRAVHDWFGHLENDCDFSMRGEWEKFNHVKHRYPKWVRSLLFTEIVGQRAAAGYLPDGFSDELFTQKPVSTPRHLRDMCRTVFK